MIGQKILLSTTVRLTHCRRPLELHWYLPESSTLTWNSNSKYRIKNEIKNCNSKLKKIKIKIEIAQISVRVLHSSNLTWQSTISTSTSINLGEDLTIAGSK